MRKTYLDNIRWITVVLVVFYHVIYIFNSIQTAGVIGPLFSGVQYQDLFQYIVYPWFMVLLFVVSGISARLYLDHHTDREFLRSRTAKLLIPSTVGLLVFHWTTGYFNMRIANAFEQMSLVPKPFLFLIMCLSGTGPLWFIQLLWFFSLLLILFRKLEKDRLYNFCSKANTVILVLYTVVIWGSAQILNTPIIVVYRFGIYGAAFFFGYYVLSHEEVMDKLTKNWLPLVISALVLTIAFCIIYWQQPYAEHIVLDTPLCNACAWICTLAILAFMRKFGNFSNSFSRFMNRQSWGLYIFHYLPLAAAACFLAGNADRIPYFCIYLLTAMAAFLGSFLLNETVSRIPLLNRLVLGITKKKG